MRIPISRITAAGLELDEALEASLLPQLRAVSRQERLVFCRPVRTRCRATLAGETVLIDGRVETALHLPCSRCLEPFDLAIKADFSLSAVSQPPASLDAGPVDDIQLTADDTALLVYGGDSIDLQDEIAQQVIMALPFKPLCREGCKGLCSRCGADLNRSACSCEQPNPDNPFARLKKLTLTAKAD